MTKPKSDESVMLAIAAATGTACATSLLAGFVFALAMPGSSIADLLDASFYGLSLYVGIVAATVALIVCPLLFVVLGLPLHSLSLRKGWVSASAYIAMGLVVSSLAAVASKFVVPFASDRYLAAPLLIAGGTAATVTFWMVARPDKSSS